MRETTKYIYILTIDNDISSENMEARRRQLSRISNVDVHES